MISVPHAHKLRGMLARCSIAPLRFLSSTAGKTIAEAMPSLERLKVAEGRFMLPATTTMSRAAEHLLRERLSFALVVDESEGAVVGLVNERNLLKYANHAGDLAFFSGREQGEPCVDQWMSSKEEMLCVRLDDTPEHAASLLANRGIWRHLPVLDHWKRLHSILDVRDVVDYVVGEETRPAAWKGKTAADILGMKRRSRLQPAGSGEVDWRQQLEAYLLQNASTHTVSANKSVEHAARQALDSRLTFLVAVETDAKTGKERVVGLVNERSFLAFCAAGVPGSTAPSFTPVASIMTPLAEVISVSLSAPVSQVVDVFFNHNVRHVPVIDGETLSGVLSWRDLLRALMA